MSLNNRTHEGPRPFHALLIPDNFNRPLKSENTKGMPRLTHFIRFYLWYLHNNHHATHKKVIPTKKKKEVATVRFGG